MPKDKRHIRFRLGLIADQNERDKQMYNGGQFIACIFLILSLCGALSAVFIMSGMMVGDTGGFYAQDNFEFAVVAMRAGVFCLYMGVFCLGMVYIEDLMAIYRGEPAITTTDLTKLPERLQKSKGSSNIFVWLMPAYIIILMLILIFVPHNQWLQMAVALIAGILLLVGAQLWLRARTRTNSKKAEIQAKAPDSDA